MEADRQGTIWTSCQALTFSGVTGPGFSPLTQQASGQ